MVKINENYLSLAKSYLFSEIGRRVTKFQGENPEAKIIRMGIGDVTKPLGQKIISSLHSAVDEMGDAGTFRGYGPEQGYDFLINKIIEKEYAPRGVTLGPDEIFVSDGSKCDTANIQEIFGADNVVAVTDPVYPVYLDTNVMAGRAGKYDEETRKYEKIVYLPTVAENGFNPELPKEKVDLIYLCLPNNPTGSVLKKEELAKWVDYAKENGSVILFDAAYEAFITEPDIPHSIYEVPGADEVAIEFRSFSKKAGFTGARCAFTVVPKKIIVKSENGKDVSLNQLWNRRHTTKFNGTSYIIQRAAEAVYTPEGEVQTKEIIAYYMENARLIREGLKEAGFEVYGGINAPYIWVKTPSGMSSWDFFDKLLQEANVVGTPGSGFGPSGEGYFRFTAFGQKENVLEAIERIKNKLKS